MTNEQNKMSETFGPRHWQGNFLWAGQCGRPNLRLTSCADNRITNENSLIPDSPRQFQKLHTPGSIDLSVSGGKVRDGPVICT